MTSRSRFLAAPARCAALALAMLLSACGGGGGGGAPAAGPATSSVATPLVTADNAVALTVDKGVDGSAVNSPYVDVTVCQPGTQTCQVIDHVLVDTGSFGLRIEASALQGLSLPASTAPNGSALAECASFASGYTWGAVRTADVQIGGKQAAGLPVQVVRDAGAAYANIPASCSNTGAALNTAGSKGVLGIGFFARDCGTACVGSASPNTYFACTAAGNCQSTATPLASQVANPVPFFTSDNNGVALTFPAVPLGGVGSVQGVLLFGVGTRDNNLPGALPVYRADSGGNVRTTYRGRTGSAFIDSGSNAIFFNDASIARCGNGFYCPASVLSLSATITGTGPSPASTSVDFQVENARIATDGVGAAHLGGDLGLGATFDWGLPFFFGRTVYVVFQGANGPGGAGPYWSF